MSACQKISLQIIVQNGISHSKSSLLQKTGYATYDWWKKILVDNLTEEELKNLYIQKEYL